MDDTDAFLTQKGVFSYMRSTDIRSADADGADPGADLDGAIEEAIESGAFGTSVA